MANLKGRMAADGTPIAHACTMVDGLRFVSRDKPGITRKRRGKSFEYRSPEGRLIRDEKTLKRIRALAIPPAYENVWISPDPLSHVQAVGRDARGRLQYRYH